MRTGVAEFVMGKEKTKAPHFHLIVNGNYARLLEFVVTKAQSIQQELKRIIQTILTKLKY